MFVDLLFVFIKKKQQGYFYMNPLITMFAGFINVVRKLKLGSLLSIVISNWRQELIYSSLDIYSFRLFDLEFVKGSEQMTLCSKCSSISVERVIFGNKLDYGALELLSNCAEVSVAKVKVARVDKNSLRYLDNIRSPNIHLCA